MSKNEIPKNFWEKNNNKKCKNCETIKNFKLKVLKKVFQNCYDKFLFYYFIK
jgi:hypothetical protein